jgi:nucleoid DNA-binding protein
MPKARQPKTPLKHNTIRRHVKELELIKQTATTSKYHMHEVADVLDHLVANIQVMLANGESVRINGLGRFSRRRVVPRVFVSPLDHIPRMVYTSDSVSFKVDHSLRKVMQDARKSATDQQAYLLWLAELEDEGKVPAGTADQYELALSSGEFSKNYSELNVDESEKDQD